MRAAAALPQFFEAARRRINQSVGGVRSEGGSVAVIGPCTSVTAATFVFRQRCGPSSRSTADARRKRRRYNLQIEGGVAFFITSSRVLLLRLSFFFFICDLTQPPSVSATSFSLSSALHLHPRPPLHLHVDTRLPPPLFPPATHVTAVFRRSQSAGRR